MITSLLVVLPKSVKQTECHKPRTSWNFKSGLECHLRAMSVLIGVTYVVDLRMIFGDPLHGFSQKPWWCWVPRSSGCLNSLKLSQEMDRALII